MMRTVARRIRRSPYQAAAVVVICGMTFLVASFLAILGYSSQAALTYFETRPQIIAFLKDEAAPEEVSRLQRRLQDDGRVKDVAYVSKEEALSIYKQATADNPLLSELVSPGVFPASVEFSLSDLRFAEEVVAEVEKSEIVSQVGYTASVGGASLEEVVGRLRQVTMGVRKWGVGGLAVLVGEALLVVLVVMGIKVSGRRDEIEVLKLVGATPGYIRWPFMVEAVVYVVLGAVLGWLVMAAMVLYATPGILTYFQEVPVLPRTLEGMGMVLGVMLGGEIVAAVVLGLLGSLLALWRYSRI